MDIRLLVNGKNFTGWKSINIQKSLSQLAGQFEFVSSNKYPQRSINWNIKLGDACEVVVDSQTLITGYIEEIPEAYNADGYELAFSGRDVTGDLVDCSHTGKNEYLNQTIGQIIDNLIAPFGLTSVADPTLDVGGINLLDDTIIEDFKVQQGEPVFEAIAKLCASIGALPVSFGDGFLTITRAGTITTFDRIDSSINVLSANRNLSNEGRFSQYTVKAAEESVLPGLDDNPLVGVATDSLITRHRPIIINAEDEKTIEACKDRAEWEKRVASGMSRAINYIIQGWHQSNGQIWPLNKLVPINDLYFNILEQRLISNIAYDINESSGSTVTMQVVHPDTFKPRIVPLTTDFGSIFG